VDKKSVQTATADSRIAMKLQFMHAGRSSSRASRAFPDGTSLAGKETQRSEFPSGDHPTKKTETPRNNNIMNTLKDLFLSELSDMYDAEHRITRALPKLIKAATSRELQNALQHHLHETEGQITKLERVFAAFDEKPKAKKCPAMAGLLEEGDEIVSENKKSPAINAAIISAGQKVEHYETASYGCLRAWAEALGNTEAASLLEEILNEEKNADKTLNDLAPACNEEALEAMEAGAQSR
jgi:ferritin-like metal-binding protein YciE